MADFTEDPVEVLQRAKARLERPGAWTQSGHSAYKFDLRYGRMCCTSSDPEASQWCALGAIAAQEYEASWLARSEAYVALDLALGLDTARAVSPQTIAQWNDDSERTLDEVLALFDLAIDRVAVHA